MRSHRTSVGPERRRPARPTARPPRRRSDPTITLLIAADTRLYREALAESLRHEASIAILGTAASAEETCARVAQLRPDVVLLDLAMRDVPGAIRSIRASRPHARVVGIVAADGDPNVIRSAAGVAGYLSRDGSRADLVATVHAVARGETPCPPTVAAALLRSFGPPGVGASGVRAPALTPREREVLALVDQGWSNREIGRHLAIAEATVKNHVHSILQKLQVPRRGRAAALSRKI